MGHGARLVERVAPGGGFFWTCDFRWSEPPTGCADVDGIDPKGAGDCCYAFGSKVESSEHCNAFVYYWPKVDEPGIVCR